MSLPSNSAQYLDDANLIWFGANAFANVTASQTDSVLVAAIPGFCIRVLAIYMSPAGTPSSVTFNSKPAGAGTAISAAFTPASGGMPVSYNPIGWFQTNKGEGLTVTTGSGSTTGIQVVYVKTNTHS